MKPLTTEDSKTLDAIVAAIPDLMFLMDEQGIYRNVYAKGKEHLLFAPAESLIGKSARDVFEEENAAFFTEAIMESIRSASDVVIEYPLEVGGRAHYFEARIVPLVWQKSSEKHVLVIIREVSQKYEQEQKARLVEKVFEDATEGMMIEDSERFVVKVNPAMQRILEMQEEELIGRHSEFFKQMFHPDTVEEIYRGMETDAFWHGEAEVTLLSGRKKLVWLSITAVMDEQGTVSNFLVMLTDISEVRKSREQLEFMANHDILTGLPNRMLLFEHLEHSIASLKRSGRMGALLFIDLDYFKEINDNFGHHVGDKLLIEVAHRLKDAVRASDTVGRLGGDEFLLIAEDIDHIDEVMVIIQKVRELFAMPFLLDGTEIEVTPSIGVALIPDDGEDAEVLVNAADRAMYVVKERGRDGFEFYSAHYSLLSHEYFKLQRAIKQAIRQEAFVMMFQPQFSIRDGRLSGAEALLRCTLDEIRDVPIAKIISVAEESGTIAEIGQFVFRTVCRQVAQWRTLRVPPLRIAVNLSRRELGNEQLAETIGEHLRTCCVSPVELEFEITESTLMQSSGSGRRNIEALRKMGCRFSIDDFGTGYSSLSNLKEFNLDKLKIDKMFIDALETDADDQVIVSATISMAQKLGLTVVAEGVENAEQVKILETFGCDEAQGFYYSRPVSGEQMTQLLLSHTS